MRLKDVAHIATKLGMANPWANEDKTFQFLMGFAETINREVILHTQNPEIVWAGSGGYWVQADINSVVPV